MSKNLIVTANVFFRRGSNRQKKATRGKRPTAAPTGSVARISRLMALAIQMQGMVDSQQVCDYAQLAQIAYGSRATLSQITSLNNLAPDIQEEILSLPLANGGRDAVREKMLRPIAAVLDWNEQRRLWKELKEKVNA